MKNETCLIDYTYMYMLQCKRDLKKKEKFINVGIHFCPISATFEVCRNTRHKILETK